MAGSEGHRHRIVERDSGGDGGGYPAVCNDSYSLIEDGVNTEAVGCVRGDRRRDVVGGVTVHAAVHPCGLVGNVIGHFALVEDRFTAFTVPHDLLCLVMLDSQARCRDVVPVHNQSVIADIEGPADSSNISVVGTPCPHIVENHVVAIDFRGYGAGSQGRSANAEVNVADRCRIACVADARCAIYSYLEEHW